MTQPAPPAGPTAVVIVNYRASGLLADRLIDATTAATVIVVDNFSDATERAAITTLSNERGWQLITREDNPGFGAGVNTGVDAAWQLGCDVVVIVNPDLEIDAVDVGELADEVRADPMVLVAPRIVTEDGRSWSGLGWLDIPAGRLWTKIPESAAGASPTWLSGACLAISRQLWQRTGGFDDDYAMYWEDVDLSVRVQCAGGWLRVLDQVVAVHAVGGTQGSAPGAKSALYLYYNCRNRLVFAAKHLTGWQQVRWVLTTGADARRVLTRTVGTRATKLRLALGPIRQGCVDGLLWLLGIGRQRSAAPQAVSQRIQRR